MSPIQGSTWWKVGRFALLGAVLFACAFIADRGLHILQQVTSPPTPYSEIAAEVNDRGVLEGNTGLKFPPSATDIHGFVDGFRDVVTLARFIIPSSDPDGFLKSASCTLPLLSTDIRRSMQGSRGLSWWQPVKAQRFQWCESSGEHLARTIFIDTTQSDTYIVYIYAWTK